MFSNKPVWELLEIPQSELNTVDCICPECGYHTAWQRSPIFLVCGWCFSSVPQPKREVLIAEIKAILSGLEVTDRLKTFTQRHSDRDKTAYPIWEHLPNPALQTLLGSIKALTNQQSSA